MGSVVALRDGVPDKSRYRIYHVKGVADGDDYAAMYEVLSRRFRRGRAARDVGGRSTTAASSAGGVVDRDHSPSPVEEPPTGSTEEGSGWELPDLFVVDGGRGQLAVALTAAHDLGLFDLCIVGLAKERETPLGDKLVDRVYVPGQKNPVSLRPNSPELFLLARVRDEAHRFANRGRKKVGKRRRLTSELDAVRGIGPKARRALLSTLGSVERIRRASDDEILATPGISRSQLAALREHFAVAGENETHSADVE